MNVTARMMIPVALLAIAGCKPTSAKLIEGRMTGFLSANSSFTLIKGSFDPADAEVTWNVDCRELDAENADLRLDDPLEICNNAQWSDEPLDMDQAWIPLDAWRGFQMDLDPWRGEGILTNEGDLQVGFHHRLPGGADFRWSFAIRPDFAPTTCVDDGTSVTAEPIDGDWLAEWSEADMRWLENRNNLPEFLQGVVDAYPDGKMYHLNARAYQINPDLLDDIFEPGRIWSLPEQWRAGFARATFGEEDFHSRPTYYAHTFAYLQADNDLLIGLPPQVNYLADRCNDLAGDGTIAYADCPFTDDNEEAALEQVNGTPAELNLIAPDGVDVDYMPIPHFNRWRRIDDEPAGIDAWSEVNYSWVVLSADSDPTPGGRVEGAFSIFLDPDDSNSRLIVQGTFEIPRVRKDRWAGPDLRQDKFDDAGLTRCIDK